MKKKEKNLFSQSILYHFVKVQNQLKEEIALLPSWQVNIEGCFYWNEERAMWARYQTDIILFTKKFQQNPVFLNSVKAMNKQLPQPEKLWV